MATNKRDKSVCVVHFNDEISKETTSKLIVDIEKKFEDGFDIVRLYFSSTGGSGSYAHMLVDYFNDNTDRIELIFFDALFSAGVWVARYAKCKKKILPETQIMVHTSTIKDGDFKDLKCKHGSSTWGVSEINRLSNKTFLDGIKEFLLPIEIRMYNSDEDVYIIDQDRISKIIKS